MNIFIIGHTKAGSHSFAENTQGPKIFYEENLGLCDYEKIKTAIDSNVDSVFKITTVSHKVNELKTIGKCIWIDRLDRMALYASMKQFFIYNIVQEMIAGFRETWPNDPIWQKFDKHKVTRYLPLCVWLVEIKDHFRRAHFPNIEVRHIENQTWYDETKTVAWLKPLQPPSIELVNKTLEDIRNA